MDWHSYYEAEINLEGLIGNLYGQREFLAAIKKINPKNILEVGTGSGGMAIFLSWLGFDVTSIDVDPEVIRKAQAEAARWNSPAKFEVADTFSLPYHDQTFDLVFHQGLMEHFDDTSIHNMLNEQLRVSRQVIFSVPNSFYMRRDFGNERLMTQDQWEKILSPYKILISRNYSPKKFPKVYLPKAKIQYMALIEKP